MKKKKKKADRSKRVTKNRKRVYAGRPPKDGNHPESDYFAENFAKNIKRLRKQRGLTQQQFADLVGIHRITVTRLEGAKHQPFIGDAKLMARALGSSLDEMCIEFTLPSS